MDFATSKSEEMQLLTLYKADPGCTKIRPFPRTAVCWRTLSSAACFACTRRLSNFIHKTKQRAPASWPRECGCGCSLLKWGVTMNTSRSSCPVWCFFWCSAVSWSGSFILGFSLSSNNSWPFFPKRFLIQPTLWQKQLRRQRTVLMTWGWLYKKREREELLMNFLTWRERRLESQRYGKRAWWVTSLRGTRDRIFSALGMFGKQRIGQKNSWRQVSDIVCTWWPSLTSTICYIWTHSIAFIFKKPVL